MVALNFPTTPADRETYEGFYWDATLEVWRSDPIPMGGLPAGSVMQWLTNTPPANWVVADGSLRSRVTDASLFAIIGTTYGVGDGSTTFALPDLRGRVPVGKDAGTFGTLAGTGGAETHTLTTAQIPAHTHTISATTGAAGVHEHVGTRIDGQTINLGNGSAGVLGFAYNNNGNGGSQVRANGDGEHTHSVSGTTSSIGTGSAHNNLQPFLVVNYIIKLSSGWSAGDSELATRLGVAEAKVVSLEAERKGTAGQPFAMAAGALYGGSGATTVTFPTGRFSVTPLLLLNNFENVKPNMSAISATSFTYSNANGSNSTLYWQGVQMTSGSAAG
jgi:microcystin-dependent protein